MTRMTWLVLAVLAVLIVGGVVIGYVIQKDAGERPADVASIRARPAGGPGALAGGEAPGEEAREEGRERAGGERRGPRPAREGQAQSEGGREERGAGRRSEGSPEGAGDREERMAQAREAMRQRLVTAGATEAEIKAIEAHRTKQRAVTERLREAMQGLREAASEGATDAQAKAAVAKYEGAMKTALSELAKADEDLKAQLKLSAKPKLHAMLLSSGTLDNGMRGRAGMRGGGPGGRGGPGEARGGGGGPGERGGPRGPGPRAG